MNEVVVSAPGKLMLLGEHAVVYGRHCLVTSVGQRLTVHIERIDEPQLEIYATEVGLIGYAKAIDALGSAEIPRGARFIEMAVKNFFLKKNVSDGLRVTTKSEFSPLFGFGSSSAVSACVTKGLSEIFELHLSQKETFEISYSTILDVQGKGSGFDVASAIYGGSLYFLTAGQEIEELSVPNLPLVIGYSGIKADTVTLMDQVSRKAKAFPEFVDFIYSGCELLVNQAKVALLNADWETLGNLMDFNHGLLEGLGVSTPELSSMVYAAREAGAYGAKLSGAGGGDCMVALIPEKLRKDVGDAITESGGHVIDIEVNVEGIRVGELDK